MSKCDYHIERSGRDLCALKGEEVSYTQYKEYCYCDRKEVCPIYQFWKKQQ